MKTDKIERAVAAIQPIKYEPHPEAYFVKMNDKDLGGDDFCKNCISGAIKASRKFHKERRAEIIKKHADALNSGKYGPNEVAKSKRSQLKKYPSKAKFSYETHDPDFGGGLNEPCCCSECGEPFICAFTPDKEQAKRLLISAVDLSEQDKWELDIAFYHYQYCEPEVQKILIRVADLILDKTQTKNVS